MSVRVETGLLAFSTGAVGIAAIIASAWDCVNTPLFTRFARASLRFAPRSCCNAVLWASVKFANAELVEFAFALSWLPLRLVLAVADDAKTMALEVARMVIAIKLAKTIFLFFIILSP